MAEGHSDLDSNVEPDECPSNVDVCRPFQTSHHYLKVGVAVSDEFGKHLNEQAALTEYESGHDKKPHQQNQHIKGDAVRGEQGEHLNEQLALTELESCHIREPYQQNQNTNGEEHLNKQLSLGDKHSFQDKVPHDQKEDGQETEEIAHRLNDICLHERAIVHGTEPLNAERTGVVEKHVIEDFAHTCINIEGDTPLHLAIICLYTIEQISCIINTILNRFPDHDVLNYQNDQLRQTPLHLAVLTGRTAIVRLLLFFGAQTNIQDNQLRTPAHIACGKRGGDALKAVLEAEDNEQTRSVSLYDNQGQTCLHIAVLKGYMALVQILLDHGADINAPDRKSGRTALHFAAEAGDIRMVTFLLKRDGLELDAPTFSGCIALQLAIGRPNPNSGVIALLRPFTQPTKIFPGEMQTSNTWMMT